MTAAHEMPLRELTQALSRTPLAQRQVRAVLAVTCARWYLEAGEETQAAHMLSTALEMVPDLRPAMRILHRLELGRGDVRNAVNYLDQEIRATRHPREAAALYRERGMIVEGHFRDLAAARQCYQAALQATPKDLAVLRSMERVCLQAGDVHGLIQALESQVQVLSSPGVLAGVLHELALLEAHPGGDLLLAGDFLLAASQAAGPSVELAEDMLRIAHAARDVDAMLRALEVLATPEGPTRALPLARASVVLREHDERDAALEVLRAAALAQPSNASSWRTLEELATATGRHDSAFEAALAQVRAVGEDEDPTLRAHHFYRAGKVALVRLGDVPQGLAAMRRALRLDPEHAAAALDTARFLSENGLWAQLLEVLRLRIALAGEARLTGSELACLHLQVGEILEERLDEPEGARRAYEQAIKVRPDFRPARDRLGRVLHQLGRDDDLRAFYREELERAQGQREVFLLSVLGQLHGRDPDPKEAIAFHVALLKKVPEHTPALQRLARLLARAGRTEDLIKVTEQEIKLTLSSTRKARLLHRVGELALQVGDRGRARAAFEEAISLVDDHTPSLGSLARLLREDAQWEPLLGVLRKRLLYSTDRPRQIALRMQIAGILAGPLDKRDEALAELRQLLERWPRHLPAIHAAEALAADEDPRLLASLLEQHIASVSGPRTRALLLHRLAQVRASRLSDPEGAVRDLVRALELWPQLGVARARLLHLYEALGRRAELQAFAQAGLTSVRGRDDRRAMALQLAELTSRAVVAIQYLGAVTEANPEDYVTQLRLARACRQARRHGRRAGALKGALAAFGAQALEDDPELLALRVRAARAEEAAGNLDAADEGYARVLDVDAGNLLAQRGRLRIKARKETAPLSSGAAELKAAAEQAQSPAERAAYLTIAADFHERRRELTRALELAEQAAKVAPDYLPALHLRARLLQKLGTPHDVQGAIDALLDLTERLRTAPAQARALCQAATLVMRSCAPQEPCPRAAELFLRALDTDPSCDPAFRGLQRVIEHHGVSAPIPLFAPLARRMDHLLAAGTIDPVTVRHLARLGQRAEGAECAAALLERGMEMVSPDASLHAALAHNYAKLAQWDDAAAQIEAALACHTSPEQAAALHFFAGEACERAGRTLDAIGHLIEAGRGGFQPTNALTRAHELAVNSGDLDARAQSLSLLVELGDGETRTRSLRELAELYRTDLEQPEGAISLLRELLLLHPTDMTVLGELHRMLEDLGRPEEARAAALAGVAHHRAWLRAHALGDDPEGTADLEVVDGLLRLFGVLGELDGVFVATGILEIAAPERVPKGRRCDDLLPDPRPLPRPQDGRVLDLIVGDLAHAWVFDILRETTSVLPRLPGAPPPPPGLDPNQALPESAPASLVVKALCAALGAPRPALHVHSQGEAVSVPTGTRAALVLGRKVGAAPFTPRARDRIGRALLSMMTGGDFLRRQAPAPVISGVLAGYALAAGTLEASPEDSDVRVAEAVAAALAGAQVSVELADPAARLLRSGGAAAVAAAVRSTLSMAADRVGAVCAADPRPAVAELLDANAVAAPRGVSLLGYLLSDDHMELRRSLGYAVTFDWPALPLEEVS